MERRESNSLFMSVCKHIYIECAQCMKLEYLTSTVLFKAWLKFFFALHCTKFLYYNFAFMFLKFSFYRLYLKR